MQGFAGGCRPFGQRTRRFLVVCLAGGCVEGLSELFLPGELCEPGELFLPGELCGPCQFGRGPVTQRLDASRVSR